MPLDYLTFSQGIESTCHLNTYKYIKGIQETIIIGLPSHWLTKNMGEMESGTMEYLQTFMIKDVAHTTTTRTLEHEKPSHRMDILEAWR